MTDAEETPSYSSAPPGEAQKELVARLLALHSPAACRALINLHATRRMPEAIALLTAHCDRLYGTAPRLALRAAHITYLVAQTGQHEPDLALAERLLAQACHAAGHYGFAIPLYERSANRFDLAGMPGEAGGSRAVAVDALMHLGRHKEAIDLAVETRAALIALGEQRRVALLNANLGNGLYLLDQPLEALQAYDQARAILIGLGDPLALARVDMSRGNALAALDRPQEAVDAFTEAVRQFSALGMTAYVGLTLLNQAYLRFLTGQYREALTGLETARAVFTEQDDRQHLAQCLLDEAEVLLALGSLEEAMRLAEQAGEALQRLGLSHDAGRARMHAAQALLRLGRLDEAMTALVQAREVFTAEANVRRLAATYLGEATIRLRQGDGEAALRAGASAGMTPGEWPARLVAEQQLLRAHALRMLGRRGARAAARRALTAARTVNGFSTWQTRHLLGLLAEDSGDLEGAARRFRQAAAEVERARGAIPTEELRISFLEDKQQLYEDAVRNALAQHQPREAFSYVERAKSRALVDLLASSPAFTRGITGMDAGSAQRIEELRAELTWLYNRVHQEADGEQRRMPGNRLAAWTEVRVREDELQRLLRRLKVRQEEYVSLRAVETITLSETQTLLPRSTMLIEYFCEGDDILAFLACSNSLEVVRMADASAEIQRALRRWRLLTGKFAYGATYVAAHADALLGTARAILQCLHQLLLAPLLPMVGSADVLIVPHGLLHGVPFQALHDGRRYLIEDRAVSYAPSASVLRFCLARGRAVNDHTLVVGVGDERTPSIESEVTAVAALFPQSSVLRGTEAGCEEVKRRARTASRVHLATHAVFRADNPAYSAVRLADGWLTLHEIYNLDLNASLVTLSGCETGSAGTRTAEELIGLVRGFLYAGTPTLVASMWVVDDTETAKLMTAFYKHIQEGAGPRAALREAQLEGLGRAPHPYYWAPFIVIGRP